MAATQCANIIANLEGWKQIKLPITVSPTETTLEELNRRTICLELVVKIDLPPPMLDPTFESIAFRVLRVGNKAGPRRNLPDSSHMDMAVPPDTATLLASLKRMFTEILIAEPAWFEDKSEKELLGVVVQQLCHIAGRENYRVHRGPQDLTEAYLFAMNLTLQLRKNREVRRIVPGPPPGLPSIGKEGIHASMNGAKGCCCCCANSPHRKKTYGCNEIHTVEKKRAGWRASGIWRVVSFSWLKRRWGRSKMMYETSSDSSSCYD